MKFKIQNSKFRALVRLSASFVIVALSFLPQAASACAACYGQSDSELAKGFNWGVLSLLFVVAIVLGGFSVFFIYLAKRSAALADTTAKVL